MKWEKESVLYKYVEDDGPAPWFTGASVSHFFLWGTCLVWLVEPYTKNPFLVATLIHLGEEILENSKIFSIEGIWSRITGCTAKGWMELFDSDSVQNFLGDMVSGLLGAWLAVKVLPTPPRWFVFFAISMGAFIYAHICHKIARENKNKHLV